MRLKSSVITALYKMHKKRGLNCGKLRKSKKLLTNYFYLVYNFYKVKEKLIDVNFTCRKFNI